MLRECVVFVMICVCVMAEISYSKLKPNPDKFKDVEGCYIEELDRVVPFEQSAPSASECMEYRCERNWLYHASCGLAVAMPPCELVEDKDKTYPDCCPHLKDSPLPEE